MRLSGNKILITGGSTGIGLGFAKKFVELGNEVIITGRNLQKLEAARAELPSLHIIQSDASDADQVAALGKKIAAEHPDTNVLMNNAGVFIGKNLTKSTQDLQGLTKELDINVAGPIRTTSALIDLLIKNNGTIINVSSGLAFVPLQAAPIYCATKAAIHSYTISLRQQLADKGVEVIELMPPAVRTDMTADLPEDAGFAILSLDELLDASFKALRAGKLEIRPGQANQLHWMSRVAPTFIQGQLEKGSRSMIPPAEA